MTLYRILRDICLNAERMLAPAEIRAELPPDRAVDTNTFYVALSHAMDRKYVRRRKAPKSIRAMFRNTRHVYGAGPVAPPDRNRKPQARKLIGHMEMARQARARARGRGESSLSHRGIAKRDQGHLAQTGMARLQSPP